MKYLITIKMSVQKATSLEAPKDGEPGQHKAQYNT